MPSWQNLRASATAQLSDVPAQPAAKLWSWSKWAAVRDAALSQLEATEIQPLSNAERPSKAGIRTEPLLVGGSFLSSRFVGANPTDAGLARAVVSNASRTEEPSAFDPGNGWPRTDAVHQPLSASPFRSQFEEAVSRPAVAPVILEASLQDVTRENTPAQEPGRASMPAQEPGAAAPSAPEPANREVQPTEEVEEQVRVRSFAVTILGEEEAATPEAAVRDGSGAWEGRNAAQGTEDSPRPVPHQEPSRAEQPGKSGVPGPVEEPSAKSFRNPSEMEAPVGQADQTSEGASIRPLVHDAWESGPAASTTRSSGDASEHAAVQRDPELAAQPEIREVQPARRATAGPRREVQDTPMPVHGNVRPGTDPSGGTDAVQAPSAETRPDKTVLEPDVRSRVSEQTRTTVEVAQRNSAANTVDGAAVQPSAGAPLASSSIGSGRPEANSGVLETVAPRTLRQVADRLLLLAASRRREPVTVRLEPKDLGVLTITVVQSDGQVDATLAASNEQVRAALQSSAPALQQSLEARGLQLGQLNIESQTTGHGAGDRSAAGQQAPQQQPMPFRFQGDRSGLDARPSEAPALYEQTGPAQTVNYTI
ncbi:MAG: flagellar hook-length control protein FliK [Fimbriimonadales bacterium]|nr:flagellar hook-length control protein FliK [Fimbriimonadales bacterium]